MTKLKIAMLSTFYAPYSYGGDAIGIERLVTALARHGHDLTVVHLIDAFGSLPKAKRPEMKPAENIKIIGLKSRIAFLSNLLTHQLGRPVIHHHQLREILTPDAFDIIWFHNVSLVGGPGLLSYGNGLKIYEAHEHWLVCPTHVLWRHNKELCDARQCLKCVVNYRRPPQLWRNLGFFKSQLNHVDVFIAKSEFSRDKHKEFGFPGEMQVVPYFLPDKPDTRDKDESSPHDRPYFLFVGRLEKIKGLDQVIPVFTEYQDADLLILGTGEYEGKLKQMANGISNVKFLGRLPPDRLSKYYQSAIALIVPSVCYETFGIILIESFREGTPVIARKIGPFPEIVNRCGGGLLYSDNNEMIEAMRKLQGNPSYRESMSEAASSGFEAYWSEKVVMNRYYDTVRQAALAAGNDAVASALTQDS
jgi:glycosyltransferase involved in cell wall biosynthesis